MDAILRATAIYFFLLVMFRLAGRRALSEVTTFDLVLLLIIGESTQQGLLGDDFSITNAFLVIATLIGIDLLLGTVKRRSGFAARLTEGLPLVVVRKGKLLEERMRRARVSLDDVLLSARATQGIQSLDEIEIAVLEANGDISIIPAKREIS
jgi:uncharacterized membrane protein YcaP (DUF421 family)